MSKIQLPIKNFPTQQQIYDNPARFVIAAKGRRFAIKALELALRDDMPYYINLTR